MLLGVACFFLLPDRPESTAYLTKEEQKLSAERMSRGTSCDTGATINMSEHLAIFPKTCKYLNLFEATSGQLSGTGVYVW